MIRVTVIATAMDNKVSPHIVAGFEHTNVEERGGSGTTCFIVTAVE